MGNETRVEEQATVGQMPTLVEAPTANLPAVVEPLKLSVAKQGDLLPLSRLTKEDHAAIDALENSTNFDDPTLPLSFGTPAQTAISEMLNTLLRDIKTEDAGVAGDLAIELASGIQELKIVELRKELQEAGVEDGDGMSFKKIMRSLPLVGKSFRHIEYFLERKQSLAKQFDQIKQKADGRKRVIIGYQVKLDTQGSATRVQLVGLMRHIIAGERVLLKVKQKFDEMASQPDIMRDPIAVADLHALRDRIVRFETRLLKLQIAYVEASQLTLQQIGLIKSAGDIEVQNIFDVLLFDLPRMQATILNIAALIGVQRSQRDTARQRKASEQIQDASSDILRDTILTAKESEGNALAQVEHLAKMTEKLTKTMELAKAKEKESAEKRDQAAALLSELVQKMSEKEKEFVARPSA